MNYIGLYLCYLPQTAKLINVLSSVLTQLFLQSQRKVRCNFLRAAAGTFSVKLKEFSSLEKLIRETIALIIIIIPTKCESAILN